MKASDYDRLFDRFRHESDGEALARLFDLLAPDLLRLARSLSGKGASAEDHVQSTFLVAIERRDRYRGEGRFFAWLAGILVNEIRRDRGHRRRQPDPHRLRSQIEEALPAHRLVEDDEAAVEINRALESMPEPYRGVLEMRLSHDLLPDEIAGRLGRRPGTVRSQLHRGLAMLRRCLPAGLAAFAFGVLPTGAALGAVRSVVTQRAGEIAAGQGLGLAGTAAGGGALAGAGMTAGVGVAATVDSKVVILLVAAVLAAVPVAYVVMQDEGDEDVALRGFENEIRQGGESARRAGALAKSDEVKARPTPPSQDPNSSPAPLIIPPSSRAQSMALFVDDQPSKMTEVMAGALPEGISRTDFSVWPMTEFAKDLDFRDVTSWRVEQPGKATVLRHESWEALVALVGVEDSPYLNPVLLSGRSRFARVREEAAHWTRRARIAVSRLEDKKASNPVTVVRMRLWTRDGIVERPMVRQDRFFVSEEVLPQSFDVRVSYADGGERLIHANAARGKPSKTLPVSLGDEVLRLRVVDAEGGAPVASPKVQLFTRFRPDWGEALPVETPEGDVFEIRYDRKRHRELQVLIRAPGYFPRLMPLPKKQRGPAKVAEIEIRRRSSRRGRLLDHRGEVLVRAQVRVLSTTYGGTLLTCTTDEAGILDWRVGTTSAGRAKTALLRDLHEPFTVMVKEHDGGLALLNEVDPAMLLAGGDLVLSQAPRSLQIQVLDEEGEVLRACTVEVQIPGVHDDRLGNPADVQRITNADGLADFGVIRADRVVVTANRRGFFPFRKVLEIPAVTVHKETLQWPELGKLSGKIEGLREGLADSMSLRIVRAGTSTRSLGSVFVSTKPDEKGNFSFDVPRGTLFDLHTSARVGVRGDYALRVVTKKIPNLGAGDESVLVKVLCGRLVAIEVTDEDGALLSTADLRWVDDPLETSNSWESSREGFAGSWSKQRRSLLLPFGAHALTVVAQGKRVLRRTVTITEETESLSFRLASGSQISGEVQGPSNGVLILRLVNFDGAEWPEPWLEPAREWNGYSKTTRIDEEGRFLSPPLTPGRWQILVGRKLLRTVDLRSDVDLGVLDLGK
jgi:RNA polymerase sigma factor (sigma-70 family)